MPIYFNSLHNINLKLKSGFYQIDNISSPSLKEFHDNYGSKGVPVLIKNIMNDWGATNLWTNDFFENQMGKFTETGERSDNRNDKKLFKIADYIKYMKNCPDLNPYYLKNCQFHLKTEMINDYVVPEYFRSCFEMFPEKMPFKLSWLYIGATNTYSNLHLDIYGTSAWNALLSGQKIWLFYPASEILYLYEGQVNPFAPDLNRFPAFAKAKPIICVQNPGEIVFTPGGWWHAVYNEIGGISLTENFVNETNYDLVKLTLSKHKKTTEVELLDFCMQAFLKEKTN